MSAKRIIIYLISMLAATSGMTAAVSYNDVAVVVNTNSSASVAIGNYFRNARSIPAQNMIYVACDTTEEIDNATFTNLRSQIESHLTTNNLVNVINYIVTTKGVPLKVNRGDTFSINSPSASVENELALILGSYSSYIGQQGRITSPYYYASANFSRASYGIYLVTRLDGFVVDHVYNLIDRSGPGSRVNPTAKYILDQDPDWNSVLPSLNNYMIMAKNTLEAKGKPVELDPTTTFLTSRSDVVGYVSWGSNDHYHQNYTVHAIPNNIWSPGSIAETYVSTSGRTFQNPPTYGQSLIADLIAEGITGVKGYVYEPFSSAMALAFLLFDRYTANYNLAESYYMSSRFLSWMDVIVGDPKTSINDSQPPLPVQLQFLDATFEVYSQRVTLSWGTVSEINNYGFYVQWSDTSNVSFVDIPESFVAGHGTTLVPTNYNWVHENVPPGTYYYRLRQVDLDGTQHFSESRVVSASPTLTDVTEDTLPMQLALAQNYPNPFNPATVIRYSIPEGGKVSLKVYNSLGQEVTTLVDEVQAAGEYAVTFSLGGGAGGTGLASGMYLYTLQTERQSISKKMLLVK